MTKISTNSREQQHVWLLYADLNSRFNTLLDECQHLKTTIFGMLPWHHLFSECDGDQLSDEVHKTYRNANARERTFFSLFRFLRTLALAIEANKETCLASVDEYFEKAIRAQHTANEDARKNRNELVAESFFWFAAQRAFFIDQGFRIYTRELEHAHEKLIQILENSPGATPQPVLLRRWNSATYEDFLSGYFSHVKWEIRQLVGKLLNKESKANEPSNLTHSWTHSSTSEVTAYYRKQATERTSTRHGSVRSAFFYLEQPALFPLLYHESGHFYFPTEEECQEAPNDSFFRQLGDAAHTLKRGFPYPLMSKDWLQAFATEIWIDALAIRLSGVPYVSALFSQLFAFSVPSHFVPSATRQNPIVLADFGTLQLRDYPVHAPDSDSDNYLWEARLLLAITLCKEIGIERASSSEIEWLDSAEVLIDSWVEGGKRVFQPQRTSTEHSDYWEFRASTNLWVKDVLWSYLEPTFSKLKEFRQGWQYHFPSLSKSGEHNPIESSPVPTIGLAVGNYISKTFERPDKDELVCKLNGLARLDACPVAVRWLISEPCLTHMRGGKNRIRAFSDFVRHDGHAAFRLAMEWQLARDSYFQQKAKEESSSAKISEVILRRSFDNAVSPFVFQPNEDAEFSKLRHEAAELLRKANDYFEERLGEGQEMPIATLSLGLIRPADIALHEATASMASPYLSRLTFAKDYFEAKTKSLNEQTESVGGVFSGEFFGLIGDYSFLHILRGSTPVERDCAEKGTPRVLTKPRAVLIASEKKANDDEVVGKVTLCRQDHRYRWLELVDALRKSDTSHLLCLSSGWEDVVLITWHRSMEELQQSREKLNLIHTGTGKHDAQSLLVFNLNQKDFADVKVAEWMQGTWSDQFKKILSPIISERYEVMGRYDFTITWKRNVVDTPQKMAMALGQLPKSFWGPITHYSVGIRQCWSSASPKLGEHTTEFITRFVLE